MSAPAAVEMIKAHLADLQMPGSLEVVDALMEQLDGGIISAAEALERILSAQVSLRRERRIISTMSSSRLRGAKTLDSFDFSSQPSIDRALIMNLHQLGFITRKENVIFPGPADVGNTHLAISLAITAAERGRRVYYGTLSPGGGGTAGEAQGSAGYPQAAVLAYRVRDRLPARQRQRGQPLFPTGERPLREGVDRADLQQELPGFC